MTFAVGSLVRARGREWVVLPDSNDELLVLRPLGGGDDEVAGVLTQLEPVEPASFALPDPARLGDHRSARLLRDALRLGFRSSAGPFRSFGHIAVEPRPYQLVPLLMALRLDPVRLLIADDVGIGKTVEAGLIARELLDQGEVQRLCVLCPPHLAEQWQAELKAKFHIDAQLVLPSTASRLERDCRIDQTLFDLHRFVIVSTDYIKSDHHRGDFVRTCPELVIIDEAHTCAEDADGRGGRHQRHQLAAALAAKADRHVILVTATPHSGKAGAFRSLLSLLDPAFAVFPDDLSGAQNEPQRRQLARQFVQRRRKDIEHFLHADTPFPGRKEAEEKYTLTPAWRALFNRVLAYAREEVLDDDGHSHRQRVRWWSALALLRALSSSPAAAAATLRTRASTADTNTIEEADSVGRRAVLDLGDTEEAESLDVNPGADWSAPKGEGDGGGDPAQRLRRRLNDLARDADALKGDQDPKLLHAARFLTSLVNDRYRPIVFCRFIATAEYLAEELRRRLPKGTEVIAVTGSTPASEREARIAELARPENPRRVLVATDCLSEGVNLQEHFDAVVHYDLSWNPTRHEQREGRVDRYGQATSEVRIVTYYSLDNMVDPIVLDVLLRKHKKIRTALGVSIPVPGDPNDLMQALVEGILRRPTAAPVEQLGFDAFIKPQQQEVLAAWESVAEREKRTRSLFAQVSIKVDEVERELKAVRDAIGAGTDVRTFVKEAIEAHHGAVVEERAGALRLQLAEAPPSLRDAVGGRDEIAARFELPVADGEELLTRTHPVVGGLASYVLDAALDSLRDGAGRRCGAIRTDAIQKRTTLLLVRYRFDLVTRREGDTRTLLAEDCGLLAFTGSPKEPAWLDSAEAERLLGAAPAGNVTPEQAREFVEEVVNHFSADLASALDADADRRAADLAETHRRVRQGARQTGVRLTVKPHRPPDVLGIYVFLPGPARSQPGGR